MINFKKENLQRLKMCETCGAFGYKGAWNLEEPSYLKEKDPEEKIYIQFKSCPACRIKELLYQCNSKLLTK